jgi:FtsP/CotA-like multicopper oxidase with cupredoxin domain
MDKPLDDPGPDGPAGSGMSRRSVLRLAAATGTVAAAGTAGLLRLRFPDDTIGPRSREVTAADRSRPRSGRITRVRLTAAAGTVDLAGKQLTTWLFNGKLHGPEIRMRQGDRLKADVHNALPRETSVHWHGLALRNDMDGVPGMTGPSIAPATTFGYDFTVPDAGTYWYHPHVGVQLDGGLYGPLIIEDPAERSSADVEHVLVFDD